MSKEKVDRRGYLKYIGAGAAAVVIGGVAYYAYEATKPTPTPTPTPVGKQFEGIKLTGVGPNRYITKPMYRWSDLWKKETGGEMESIVEVPGGEMFEKLMTDFVAAAGAYDIIALSVEWTGEFAPAGYLADLTDYVENKVGGDPMWEDIFPTHRSFAYWGDRIVSLPYDGDLHLFYYRKDLFSNPEYQEEFKSKYGYDLPVNGPRTWAECLDLAEYFNGWDWDNDGEIEYGMSSFPSREWHGPVYWLWDHTIPYIVKTGPPTEKNLLFFDLPGMEPLVNTPPYIRGLEEWIKTLEYCPPGVLAYTYSDCCNEFIFGNCAMNFEFADTYVMAHDLTISGIEGVCGTCMIPGSYDFYDRDQKKWIKLETLNQPEIMALGGWYLTIPATTTDKKRDAAYDFCRFMISPEASIIDAMDPGTGINPYRESNLDPARWELEGYIEPEEYLTAIRNTLANGYPILRIPGVAEYNDVLLINITSACAGEMTPKDALDETYEKWEEITDRMGRDKQETAYRASLGI